MRWRPPHPGAQRDRHHRQLFDLVARRLTIRAEFSLAEDMAAATPLGPVLDHLIHRAHRQQLTPVSLLAGLRAWLAPGAVLAAPRRRGRRVDARRLRAIARAAIQPALELSDPLVLARNPLLKPPDLLIHTQQDRHHNLAALIVDRLRLRALHA
jgi:hypothetical protein